MDGQNAPATVTDADLLLGYLHPDRYLGGRQSLDLGAAERALAAVADPLGLTVRDLALGVGRIVAARIADRIQVVAARRGVAVADCSLLPFGGAGGVHAVAVAEELGLRRILDSSRARARSPPWDCSARTWCTTTRAPSCGGWTRRRPRTSRAAMPR